MITHDTKTGEFEKLLAGKYWFRGVILDLKGNIGFSLFVCLFVLFCFVFCFLLLFFYSVFVLKSTYIVENLVPGFLEIDILSNPFDHSMSSQ